jgi:hypothetical protein
MNHEKTFDAINKLKEVELELHRLKNALEMANRALDAQRKWVGLTDEEIAGLWKPHMRDAPSLFANAVEAKLKEKNT